MSKVHYHRDGVFDSFGRGAVGEGLHGCDYHKVPLLACTDVICMSKDLY